MSNLSFNVSTPASASRFGPRIGKLTLKREGTKSLLLDTPGFLTATSRGVVPHLSRDHHHNTPGIRWINVPFETFLEHTPPVPTLQPGNHTLHTFLGYSPSKHILSISIRDPHDGRDMPPNGKDYISAYCVRGVRKVSVKDWHSYVLACKPDIAIALSDTPFTPPPYSQKRLTKSIERSTAWLLDLLRPVSSEPSSHNIHPNVLVHMIGGASAAARKIFAERLIEPLDGKEAEAVKPLKSLDEGVVGYVFDLVSLRLSLSTDGHKPTNIEPGAIADDVDSGNTLIAIKSDTQTEDIVPLLKSSLLPLPYSKLRIVNSSCAPHEMLDLIRHVGIDLFDAHWAQRAADIGIALDFRFPLTTHGNAPCKRDNGKRDIGHNLYDSRYAHDFSSLAGSLPDGAHADDLTTTCPCAACSPRRPATHISHSAIDAESFETQYAPEFLPCFTRAYLHHLLHTHEMSSHSLLVMHNIAVLDAFFIGIRRVLGSERGIEWFDEEVEKFVNEYDEKLVLFDEAWICWREVELARGKGRLAREKAK